MFRRGPSAAPCAAFSPTSRYSSKLANDHLLTILREEGIDGLYKGVGNKFVKSVLTAAILFVGQKRIYEMTKKVRFVLSSRLPILPS